MTDWFQRDGIRFAYDMVGEGVPIVMCHGLGGDRNQPRDLCGVIPHRQLVVWDARAHGETEPVGPEEKLSFSSSAEDLCALMDFLRIDRCVVGGISMGAAISTRLALDFPERILALVLVRPAWCVEPHPENLGMLPLVADALEHGGRDAFVTQPDILNMQSEAPAVAGSILQQFDKPSALARRARLRRIPADCPVQSWEEVGQIVAPALVVGNAEDPMHPLAMAEEWAERLPNATLAVIPSKSQGEKAHRSGFRRAMQEFLAKAK